MLGVGRVTVTLPEELLRDIDRREKDRSRFIADAVRRELDRRRRAELRRFLELPTPKLPCLRFKAWKHGRAACLSKEPRRSSTPPRPAPSDG